MKKLLLLLVLTAALPTAAMAQSTGEEPERGINEVWAWMGRRKKKPKSRY